LAKQLWQQTGVQLITKLGRTMKNPLLLRKGSLIETIIDQLKNISPIEHSWHPSLVNFLVNLAGGLIAYCHQPKKNRWRLTQTCSLRLIHN
jgi:Transposase DDE domain